MKKIEKIELNGHDGSLQLALSCHYDGARFHIWLNRETLKPCDSKLYKNSIAGYKEEGYFSTRYLEQNEGVGAKIVPVMLLKAAELKDATEKSIQLEEAHRCAINEDSYRDVLVERAGKTLLVQLQKAIKFFEENGGDEDYTFLPGMKAAVSMAKTVPMREPS